MKFVLYFIIIIVSSAILKRILGNREDSKTELDKSRVRLLDPNPDDFAAWLIEKACEQCGEGVRNDPLATSRLNESARKALQDIKRDGKSVISIPYLIADQSGPKHFDISVDNSALQKL